MDDLIILVLGIWIASKVINRPANPASAPPADNTPSQSNPDTTPYVSGTTYL